jgi:hypothetical protein
VQVGTEGTGIQNRRSRCAQAYIQILQIWKYIYFTVMMRKSPFLTRELYAAVAALKVWLMAGELVAGQLGGAGEVARTVLRTALQHIVLKMYRQDICYLSRIENCLC